MIQPSLREKKRYLIIETLKETPYESIRDNLYKEVIAFLGSKGAGELGLIFLKDHYNGKKGIIRVSNDRVNELKTVIGLMKEIKTKTIKTTGSLLKAKKIMSE